jgi:hypothetical protein
MGRLVSLLSPVVPLPHGLVACLVSSRAHSNDAASDERHLKMTVSLDTSGGWLV